MLKSPGGGGEGEEEISIPAGVSVLCACDYASDIACASVLVVLSSTRSWCLQTAPTATESMAMAVFLPRTVAVAVKSGTQTSELIVVESPDAPSQMTKD